MKSLSEEREKKTSSRVWDTKSVQLRRKNETTWKHKQHMTNMCNSSTIYEAYPFHETKQKKIENNISHHMSLYNVSPLLRGYQRFYVFTAFELLVWADHFWRERSRSKSKVWLTCSLKYVTTLWGRGRILISGGSGLTYLCFFLHWYSQLEQY